jgi:integrase
VLTYAAVSNAKPRDKAYKLSDGGGLYLLVSHSGHRSWRMKYRFGGKEYRMIFGTFPEVSLMEAREKRDQARVMLRDQKNPNVEIRKEKARTLASHDATFERCARSWFSLQIDRWTGQHARNVIESLETDIFPMLGKIPIIDIDEPMVLEALRAIERRGAIETAHRIRQRMSAVFVHGIAEGIGTRDPAAVITMALRRVPKAKPRPALLTIEALQELMAKTEDRAAAPLTKLASRFTGLTAQRPSMIRGAAWYEIEHVDWDAPDGASPSALWRIPADRVKQLLELKSDSAFDHLVPLAPEAVAILREVYRLTGRGPLIFPTNRNAHRPMSENTIGSFYNDAGFKDRHTPHGWRASFSTIMNEWCVINGTPGDRQIIDLMLAHVPEGISSSETVYNRAAHLPRRRDLAEIWATMLMDGMMPPSNLLFGPRQLRANTKLVA